MPREPVSVLAPCSCRPAGERGARNVLTACAEWHAAPSPVTELSLINRPEQATRSRDIVRAARDGAAVRDFMALFRVSEITAGTLGCYRKNANAKPSIRKRNRNFRAAFGFFRC